MLALLKTSESPAFFMPHVHRLVRDDVVVVGVSRDLHVVAHHNASLAEFRRLLPSSITLFRVR
jgi:hypothetical protein